MPSNFRVMYFTKKKIIIVSYDIFLKTVFRENAMFVSKFKGGKSRTHIRFE